MLEIGSLVDGKYKILNEIGRGGMSVVYMAINEKANKTWAVKEVRKDGVLDFESVKQGLVAETDILTKLNHPHLPSIIDVIDADESFIIIMDYIEGNDLQKTLDEYGAQPQEIVIDWAKQLCDVLGYLHSRQPAIIYRDMKPKNVMLKPDGNVALIDFGTAREYKEKKIEDTICLGTYGYAAPEQSGGMGQTDARTDIYCLGATLYHLVTGCNPSLPPYEIKLIREINPNLSSGLEKIIEKCTQRDPNLRYQTAAELMYALEHYEEIDDLYRKKQKKKFALFLATAILTICFAVSGFVLNLTASKMATNTYDIKIDDAAKTAEYATRIELYEECISIPNMSGRKDAYLGLINTYKENDSVFSVEEAQQLEKLIKNNKAEIKEDPASYTEVCFETGKLFWYYYDYGNGSSNQITNAKSSVEWFQDVINNAPEGYENLGTAKAYANIGTFYRDIATHVKEASDKGKYKPLYDNLNDLIDTVASDEKESEIVRLELIELARSAIQQYSTKFKIDGVTYDELDTLYTKINKLLSSISVPTNDSTDVRTVKKSNTLEYMEETKNAIEIAFGTNKEGN